jgi:hypothetical protein
MAMVMEMPLERVKVTVRASERKVVMAIGLNQLENRPQKAQKQADSSGFCEHPQGVKARSLSSCS